MQSQINKWGNSAAVRIPASVLAELGLSVHSTIDIQVDNGKIIIEPLDSTITRLKLPYSEAELLAGLDENTAHADAVAAPLSSEWGE
jgi:antitoxin MazE